MSDVMDQPEVLDKDRAGKKRSKKRNPRERDSLSKIHKIMRVISSSINNFIKILSFLGGAIVLDYCRRISFTPKGLSLSEVPFFLMSLFLFGGVAVAFLVTGILATILPMSAWFRLRRWGWPETPFKFEDERLGFVGRVFSKIELSEQWKSRVTYMEGEARQLVRWVFRCLPQPKRENRINKNFMNSGLKFLSIIFFVLYIVAFRQIVGKGAFDDNGEFSSAFNMIASTIVVGCGFTMYFLVESAKGGEDLPLLPKNADSLQRFLHKYRGQWPVNIVSILFLLTVFLVMGSPELIENTAMERLKIRVKNASIGVSGATYEKIVAGADSEGMKLCSLSNLESGRVFGHVDVYWRGMGENALIKVNGISKDDPQKSLFVIMTVTDKEMELFEGEKKQIELKCNWIQPGSDSAVR